VRRTIGNKATNLIWLKQRISQVPDFIIIDPAELVRDFKEINDRIRLLLEDPSSVPIDEIQKAIHEACLDPKGLDVLSSRLKGLNAKKIIFRTSAAQEDTAAFSFAGMYRSFGPYDAALFDFEDVLRGSWESLYSERTVSYARVRNQPVRMQNFCIVAQEFFLGVFSGVAFVDPGERKIVLTIGEGVQAVVEGENAHTNAFTYDDVSVPAILRNRISGETWKRFLATIKHIAHEKERPQDIEWILQKNNFAIVQTRDVTVSIYGHDDEIVWDNTNIAESYPGITLPLTFSFIRHAYSRVYPHFLQLVGVPSKNIKEKQNIFINLLGHIHGHVYYNVRNWYEMIRLLPGYRFNKDFFEAMWNPKKKLSEKTHRRKSLLSYIALAPLFTRFLIKIVFIRTSVARFLGHYQEAVDSFSKTSLTEKSLRELKGYYLAIEDSFFSAWAVPILNDFRVMIFHGMLRRLVTSEKGEDEANQIISSLLTQDVVMRSFAPIEDILHIAHLCKESTDMRAVMTGDENNQHILQYLRETPGAKEIYEAIVRYIDAYGDRNPSELKLESPTMKERPELIIDLIKHYIRSEPHNRTNEKKTHHDLYLSKLDEFKKIIRNKSKMAFPLLWPISTWILATAKDAVATREHLRLLRSSAFGIARKMFYRFGVLLGHDNIIFSSRDIFYLTREEVLRIADGTGVNSSVAQIVEQRKHQFKRYRTDAAPSRRIRTVGYPVVTRIVADTDEIESGDVKTFRGIAASPGRVTAEVLCMKEFDSALPLAGKILVTLQTDPGWTTVFPLISGLITERGNILSHAAIISRELGIPSVLAIERITDILKTGDVIELDGNLGTVTKKND